MPNESDHSLLLTISTSLARLESKVDALTQRIDSLDRRLEDHEARLRRIESVDVVTIDAMQAREKDAVKGRRWLIGIGVTVGLGVIAEAITIIIALIN